MKVSGADVRNLTSHAATADRAPNWSPNGRRIVFDSNRDSGDNEDNIELYTMSVDGSRVRRLTENTIFDGQPNWSPNGRRISFQAYRDEHLEIWTMRADGGRQEQLTHGADAFASAWSPDGCLIVHSSFDFPDIFTIPVDGGEPRNLTRGSEAFDFAPDWQPLRRRGHNRSWGQEEGNGVELLGVAAGERTTEDRRCRR